ncbi:MAG TPA: DNA polymerase I [Crocinitomicaceae bacterium]|nr:DNA polymerase I [Crocinitomicaceae bacterium]
MLTVESDKKLFLLDAYALIYRAFFAFSKNPRMTSKGQNTSAAFGFTTALLEILTKEKPTHLAVVFDGPGGSTDRQADFSDYKANREEMPEGIRTMIEPIKNIIRAMNIPVIQVDGYEADDIIGTLSKQAERDGFITYMVTPDKDFGQLVTEKSLIYRPSRGGDSATILGIKEVCEKFEIENTLQVIDILGLWGDASDNIPGIPGIGEKRAKELIKEYGSLENVIANADNLKGKMRENVINFAEQGILSKKLATIIIDAPIEMDEEDFKMCEPNIERIKEIFTELEFRNLAKRIIGEEIVVLKTVPTETQLDLFSSQSMVETQNAIETSSIKTIATERPSYHLITLPEERQELINLLLQQPEIAFDTETNNIDSFDAEIVGMSFAYRNKEAFYVAMPEEMDKAQEILEQFKPVFENTNCLIIGQNLKYDLQVLANYNIAIKAKMFDTMIAHYLIQPEARHGMDFLAEYYLNYKTVSIEDILGKKGKTQKNMRDLLPSEICDYACEDADITFQLKTILTKELLENQLNELFETIEMPLMPVLQRMENEGIAIDTAYLNKMSFDFQGELLILQDKILALAGVDFNIDSPKQLGEILFDHLKISAKAKKTKTGQYQTSEEVLETFKNDHEIIPLILDYRQLKKLKSTYIDPLPELCKPKDGRIHTTFMQTVTATGRLSSNNPNLQNIPIRTERGRAIRKAFIARDAQHLLVSADYSQIELRIIAALSHDENMIQAFKNGEDIHRATAAKVFNTPFVEVTRDQRSAAKAVNFGIIYGQSAFGLSQNLGISRTEAKEIIDNYFVQYPTIKTYMDEAILTAREKGYVETVLGRRRFLPDITSANAVVRGFAERNAINAPIQGSAADIIKIAMIKVDDALKTNNLKTKMLLQVHDELVFDVPLEEVETAKKVIADAMENAFHFSVPLEVEAQAGKNWLEAH